MYSIRFEDNKNVATSVTTPATSNSEVGVNLDVTTQEAKTASSSIISDFSEKSNTFSGKFTENSGNKKFSNKSDDVDNYTYTCRIIHKNSRITLKTRTIR